MEGFEFITVASKFADLIARAFTSNGQPAKDDSGEKLDVSNKIQNITILLYAIVALLAILFLTCFVFVTKMCCVYMLNKAAKRITKNLEDGSDKN